MRVGNKNIHRRIFEIFLCCGVVVRHELGWFSGIALVYRLDDQGFESR
jgi:hypothetical protein